MPEALGAIRAALRRGAWLEARAGCDGAIAVAPDRAELFHALGISYCGEGRFEAALAPLERALTLSAGAAPQARVLAIVYARLEQWSKVTRVLAPVIGRLDPRAHALFLSAAIEAGEAASALDVLEAAARPADATDPDLRCDFGRALCAVERYAEAEPVLLECLSTTPPLARAHDALSALYHLTDRGDRGLAQALEYARLVPDSAYAQIRLAAALSLRGRLAEARAARLTAMAIGLERPADWTTAIKMMLSDTDEDGVSVLRASGRALAGIEPRPLPPRRALRAGRDRVRVGYLSGELDVPPASHFLNPFLLAHDRSQVDVFLYDTRPGAGDHPGAVARLGEHLRAVDRLGDDALLAVIDADELDVLVDLGAQFPFNRTRALARRAAPVQASLPQCPSTTGSTAVDYVLTDCWTSPPGTDGEYAERLHRLDAGYLVFSPPDGCPAARPLPAQATGAVTFGLIQQLIKIGADVWDAVAAVLRRTPGSRLVLHNGDGELSRPSSETYRYLRRQLAARGVDPGRLQIVGFLDRPAHLDLLSTIDIALDTWPYSGTTTTCECLWMGVPVVTLVGNQHASRVSAGVLRRSGVAELVAADPADYAARATGLATDIDRLRAYRATLRERVIAAGLTDGRALAAELETTYAGWVAAGSAPLAARRSHGGSAGR